MEGRAPRMVMKRYWSPQEDARLTELVERYGTEKWSLIGVHFPGRSNAACRLRWVTQLCPSIDNSPFTNEEDDIIIRAQQQLGNKWAEIARMLPAGRTDYAVKNHWKTHLRHVKRVAGGNQQRVAGGNQQLVPGGNQQVGTSIASSSREQFNVYERRRGNGREELPVEAPAIAEMTVRDPVTTLSLRVREPVTTLSLRLPGGNGDG